MNKNFEHLYTPEFQISNTPLSSFYFDAKVYDQHNKDITDDIEFYKKHALTIGGKCLEVACGTGRISIPLLEAGVHLYGLDLSEVFLKSLHAKAKKVNTKGRFVLGDMRNFSLPETFDLIFIPFNSFLHLYSIKDIDNCLKSVLRHLKPDGIFIFDIVNPSVRLLARNINQRFLFDEFPLEENSKLMCQVYEQNFYDYSSQILKVTWFFEYPDMAQDQVYQFEMRMIFPQEIDALLMYNGFTIEQKWGDFDETLFNSESSKQILICKHAHPSQD